MPNRTFTTFVIALITTATTLIGASPAAAEVTWTVTPGGSVTINGGPLTIHDHTGAAVYRCTDWSTTGNFWRGSGLSGHWIGAIILTDSSLNGCSGQITIAIQPSWPLDAESYLHPLRWTVGTLNAGIGTFSPICNRQISPTVPIIYDSTTGELRSNHIVPASTIASNECFITFGRSIITPRLTITSP